MRHASWNTVFVRALEVNDAIGTLMATTLMASSDLAGVVTTALFRQRAY
ncbi:unannotated protein [freshwater metagenome]|uniref:Unannotated protein n=1 Tax=freshwater metagenome TaxID=449393 RepID=A0A6J6QKU0_9ZZZZ